MNRLILVLNRATKAEVLNLSDETEEAIAYLGLDRCGLAQPALALQRFIKKGVLRPINIGRRNAFTKAELDRVLSKGGQARR